MLSLGLGLFDAWRALGRIAPSAVVGFGGYASVPTMIAARLRRLPSMLHEQNAVLGKANRLVLGGAARIATSFARTRHIADDDRRARLVGNPVREPVRALRGSPYRAPGADRVIDLLVFGGSQGAASFSQVVPEAILSLPPPLRARLRLVQQCRPEDLERVRARYAAGRHRGRAGAVLRRPAAAPGRRASGDRPRRRLDRGRARDHRPAVDPGALSLCRRRSPDRQRPRLRGGRRLHRDPARRVHGRDPGRAPGGAARRAAAPGRHGRRRPRRRPAGRRGAAGRSGRRTDAAPATSPPGVAA